MLAGHCLRYRSTLAVLELMSLSENPVADQPLRVFFGVAHRTEAACLVAVIGDRLAAAAQEVLEVPGGVGHPLLAPALHRAAEVALGLVEERLEPGRLELARLLLRGGAEAS